MPAAAVQPAHSGARQDRRLLLAEGRWAHEVLVGLDAAVEMFLWCPEAAYSAEARALVPVIEFADPAGAARWLRDRDFAVFLATVSAGATPYQQARYGRRTAVVVGNERTGIARAWFGHASGEITIPMLGRADSLNVAVSASILMYDVRAVLSGAARAAP